ncbi:MAG: BrnA antitoxin family protein [Rhizobiaceae bacterium]
MVTFKLDLNNLPPLTEKQKAEIEALAALPEDQIDLGDIHELSDEQLKDADHHRFYKPVKQQITARLDSDVLHWLKSQGKGYQSRINGILREKMIESLKR